MNISDYIKVIGRSATACLVFLASLVLCALLGPWLKMLLADSVHVLIVLAVLPGLLTLLLLHEMGEINLPASFSSIGRVPVSNVLKICVLAAFIIFGLNIFTEFIDLADNNIQSTLALVSHPLGIAALVLFTPLVEELVFREATIGKMLRGGIPPRHAIIISSFLFGIIHANPAQIPFAFVMGVLLGYLYCKTGTIFYSLLLHVVNNSMAVMLICVWGEDTSLTGLFGNDLAAVVVAFVFCLLGCVGIKRSV